jgi:hypothetical protein
LIGALVATSFETGAVELIGQNASGLDAAATLRMREFLGASDISAHFGRAFNAEAEIVATSMRKLAALSPEERNKTFGGTVGSAGKEAAAMEGVFRDPASVESEIAYMVAVERQMAESLAWPEERYRQWWAGVEATMKAHPMAATALPAVQGIRTKAIESQARREMLGAGVAILQEGPGALSRYSGAAGGRGFSYAPKPEGFELSSPLKVKGKPLLMKFAK